MKGAVKLEQNDIDKRLKKMPKWKQEINTLNRDYELRNFMEVVEYVNKIAKVAEKLDHHPELILYGYKNLKVMLSTHSVHGITSRDFDLAEAIDALA